MDVRLINANSLHKVISEWPEPVMYKDWVQSAIAYEPTIPVTVPISPCASCGYHGEHLDAPPCTNCPAHPKQASTNQPQPLLLSRLQRMDGKPIWYVDLKTGHCEWCILRVIHPDCFGQAGGSNKCSVSYQTYGVTWLAYQYEVYPEKGGASGNA